MWWVPLLLNLKEGGGRPSKVLGGLQASSLKAQMADTGHQTLRDCLRAVFFVKLAAGPGLARQGMARHGMAWLGKGYQVADCRFNESVFQCLAGHGMARRGAARHGVDCNQWEGHCGDFPGDDSHHVAWPGWAGHGAARPG